MPRISHNDRVARRKRLLNFLSEALEEQVRQLEELVQKRVSPDRPGAAPPSEPPRKIQIRTPEATFPRILTSEVGAAGPESVVPREEGESFGAYPMTPTLAEIYASQGLINEAISVLKQILKREPEREDVRHRLSDLLRASAI